MCLFVLQVLSASVSSAFELTGKEEFEETAKFCKMFDKFFDCLNARQAGEGKQKRKPDLNPYRSKEDRRLLVSTPLHGKYPIQVMSLRLTDIFIYYSG